MKKFIFIFIGIFLIIVLLSFISLSQKNKTQTKPQPTPTIIIPTQMVEEKKLEGLYIKDRNEFLKSKPWVLKLPLKSDRYFISYDPGGNEILATIYFSVSSSIPKDQQLSEARQAVINVVKSVGVDLGVDRIVYFETEIK
ncbi:MAG: hypothetical protein Q7R53_03075 [bacterium]|nr:hypothetical protein [bacterium]